MNLKRLRGVATAALATAAVLILAGCTNSMAGSVDSAASNMATLSLSVTGIPNDYAEQFAQSYPKAGKSSRTITPDDPYDINKSDPDSGTGQSKGLTFYLSGKSETGKVLADTQVYLKPAADAGKYDFSTAADGSTPVTLDSMSWQLTLTAYKTYVGEGDVGNKPVLQGFCSVDLRNGSNKATFVMGTAGLKTEGSVTLTGTYVDTSSVVDSFTMGIYYKTSGKQVVTPKTSTSEMITGKKFEFEKTSVAPGTYLYTMIFYNANSEIVGSFTDSIIVDPGNDLVQDLGSLDVIGQAPTAPSNLMAYLVDGSESTDGSTYNVKVTWEKAKYETNYELNVVESASDGTDLISAGDGTAITGGTGKIYGMASMDKTGAVENFPGSTVFGTGSNSLMYGEESCILKLETGKVYEIQIRARNYVGTSLWADRVAGGTETGCTAYDEPANQRINRLLITYNLNGGSLTPSTDIDAVQAVITNKYAAYKSWKSDDELLKITTDGAGNTSQLTKGGTTALNGSPFEGWLLEDGTAIDATGGTATTTKGAKVNKYTYKNVTVKASFGNKLTGDISQGEKVTDIDPSHIFVTGTAGTTVARSGTSNFWTADKTAPDGSSNMLMVKLNPATNYANISFGVCKQSGTVFETVSSGSASCTIDVGDYTAGKIYVMITADVTSASGKVNKGMTQTITIDLQ